MPPKGRRGSVTAAPPAPAAPAPVAAPAPKGKAAAAKGKGAAAPPPGVPSAPPHIVIPNKSGPPALLISTFDADGVEHLDEGSYTPSHHYMSDSKEALKPAYLPPAWVTRWFWITTLIVTWDAAYSLVPWSHDKSHPIASRLWYPYQQIYSKVDLMYGNFPSSLGPNAFGHGQSILNVVEVVLNVLYLFMAQGMESPSASVVGLIVASATLFKTVLYFVVVGAYGWVKVVPSSALATPAQVQTFVLQWLIPNGIWILVPALVCIKLGSDLAAGNSLRRTS